MQSGLLQQKQKKLSKNAKLFYTTVSTNIIYHIYLMVFMNLS